MGPDRFARGAATNAANRTGVFKGVADLLQGTPMSRRHRFVRSFLPIIPILALLAPTTLEAADVVILGNAATTPVTLVREGTAVPVTITALADDGALNGGQCTGGNNAVSTKADYVLSSSGLAVSGVDVSDAFMCQTYNGGTTDTVVLLVSASAAADAPLGRSAPTVTFGGAATHVILGDAVRLRQDPGAGELPFMNPLLHVVMNPRPASALGATAGPGQVTLTWTRSPDHTDLTKYDIAQSGVVELISVSPDAAAGTTQTATITGLTPGVEVCFTVTARFTDATAEHFLSTPTPTAEEDEVCATPEASGPVDDFTAMFKAPIDSGNVVNIAKQGRTIPVKVVVKNNGAPVTDGFVSLRLVRSNECSLSSTDAIETYASGSSNTGNQFRYDEAGGHWIYNLATGPLPIKSCWRVALDVGGDLTDGRVTGGTEVATFLIQITK